MSGINNDKPYELYESLFGKLLQRSQSLSPTHKFRFKSPLYALDPSTIDLCPSVFPLAGFRSTKAGIKFLTNNFTLVAKTTADSYRSRWEVELFFKCIQQNLKIKKFFGSSRNAGMTQIGIATCVYLLLSIIKFQSDLQLSLHKTQRLLQTNLFEKRHLIELLKGDNKRQSCQAR